MFLSDISPWEKNSLQILIALTMGIAILMASFTITISAPAARGPSPIRVKPETVYVVSTNQAENQIATQTSLLTDSNNNVILFSGYLWDVRNYGSNPGPNNWSNSIENVWVDNKGWLHLQITNRNGIWYCPEVSTSHILGYGTYSFQVSNEIENFDKNVVLGLFAYRDDSHEVDIEFSRWGNDNLNNAWFTVQPPLYIAGYNRESFNTKSTEAFSNYSFLWSHNTILFKSTQDDFNSNISTNAEGAKAHLNLWLYRGEPPANTKNVEIVIKSFSFNSAG